MIYCRTDQGMNSKVTLIIVFLLLLHSSYRILLVNITQTADCVSVLCCYSWLPPPPHSFHFPVKICDFRGVRGGGGSYWPEQKHDGFLLVAALKTFIDRTFAGKGGESPKGGVKSKINLRFLVRTISCRFSHAQFLCRPPLANNQSTLYSLAINHLNFQIQQSIIQNFIEWQLSFKST